MKATVCELPDDPGRFELAWGDLVVHTGLAKSDLVVLPEMAFGPWVVAGRRFDPAAWEGLVSLHDAWIKRLRDLAPAVVLGTRPVNRDGKRYNEAFVWDVRQGYRPVHRKTLLPNEEGFRETVWFHRGQPEFRPLQVESGQAPPFSVGFLICTELWVMEEARKYGKTGVHIIAVPRATGSESLDRWLAGGRAASVLSGTYVLSSNRTGAMFGGLGWVLGPEGDILGLTTSDLPFMTVEIDLQKSENAKRKYPRNLFPS